VTKQEFKTAIRKAKEFLGIKDEFDQRDRRFHRAGTTEKATPAQVAHTSSNRHPASLTNTTALIDDGPVFKYLVNERKIDPHALAPYGIRQSALDPRVIVYPYFSQDAIDEAIVLTRTTEPTWLKFESLDRSDAGKKREWTTRAPAKCLFGKNVISPTDKSVIICEGEKDALAWATYGYRAVSVPFGAKWRGMDKSKPSPNREWIDNDWDWLDRFDTIFVSFDSDQPGQKAAMDVINELGPRRCRLVRLPDGCKDAGDCLLKSVSLEAMQETLDSSKEFAPDKVRNAAEYESEFIDEWFNHTEEDGLKLPISFPFRFRPAELTIWTGFSGHGKTMFLNHALIRLMSGGERACIASMEVRTRITLRNLSRQAWGARIWAQDKDGNPYATHPISGKTVELKEAQENARRTLDWLGERLWLYDHPPFLSP
jgi:twinkle protein